MGLYLVSLKVVEAFSSELVLLHVAYIDFLISLCEYLAKLTIPDKIPKCPLTQFTDPYSDYLTSED